LNWFSYLRISRHYSFPKEENGICPYFFLFPESTR
jgi:hypothetical protein